MDPVMTESEASESDDDDEQGSDGKDGVIGESGAEAKDVVFAELRECAFEDGPGLFQIHELNSFEGRYFGGGFAANAGLWGKIGCFL
jgi:hypothetical protein